MKINLQYYHYFYVYIFIIKLIKIILRQKIIILICYKTILSLIEPNIKFFFFSFFYQ